VSGRWLLIGFWALLGGLLIAEALLPIHLRPKEGKGRLVTNFGLGLINAALLAAAPLSSVAAALWAEAHRFGLLNQVAVPAATAFALALLLRSLVAYVAHWASHSLPLLWRLHRVHHTDTAVDLSTGFRHHPLELLAIAPFYAAATALLGLPVAAVAAYEAASVALTLWTHVNLRLPHWVERALRLLIVTPGMHHIHHSALRAETDSNYGELFSLWDRLFGTYRRHDLDGLRSMRIGLGAGEDAQAARLAGQLAAPFRDPL
jgi:sterol desaturase/sphingolipid hydroxylase (fatty acid hydroxylase superfamily)